MPACHKGKIMRLLRSVQSVACVQKYGLLIYTIQLRVKNKGPNKKMNSQDSTKKKKHALSKIWKIGHRVLQAAVRLDER